MNKDSVYKNVLEAKRRCLWLHAVLKGEINGSPLKQPHLSVSMIQKEISYFLPILIVICIPWERLVSIAHTPHVFPQLR